MLLPLDTGELRATRAPSSSRPLGGNALPHPSPRGDRVLTQPLQQLDLGAPLVRAKLWERGIALWHAPKGSML